MNDKKQTKDLINCFVFAGILECMLITTILTIVSVIYIMPQISMGKEIIEVFNYKFNATSIIAFVIFQIIIMFFTYELGVKKVIKRNEKSIYSKLSKNSLICSFVLCLILGLMVNGGISNLFYEINISKVKSDYINTYFENVFSNSESLSSGDETIGSIIDKSVEETIDNSMFSIEQSKELLENLTWQVMLGQVIVFLVTLYFNYINFKNNIENGEEL